MESQYKTFDTRLPQEIYAEQLKTINEINFTRREVDILTCILSGKTAKHIAAFLSISSKTVENHIRHIMLKTGCRTQPAIIDLVEKSNKFPLVKKHYSSLLIYHAFALELKKISKMVTKNLNCIIYNKTLKNATPFFSYLANDLQLAGINTFIENTKKNELDLNLENNVKYPTIDTILYHLEPEQTENLDLEKITQFAHQHACRFIFIIVANSPTVMASQQLSGFETIVLQEPQNYYFFVFEILEKLLTPIDLQENIAAIKQKYKIFYDVPPILVKQKKIKAPMVRNTKNISLKKKNFFPLIFGMVCLISLMFLGVTFLNKKLNQSRLVQEMNIKGNVTTEDINTTSSSVHAAMVWNLPRQDNIFINRKQLLENLYNQLNTASQNSQSKTNDISKSHHRPIVNVVCGFGGVGKTQLVLRYAHQFKDFYTLKAWFYAENIAQLKQQYIDFSKALGFKETNPSFEAALSYIKTSLSKRSDWLLIYDNVTGYKEINDFLPEGGGHIIMTTRQRHWPNTFNLLGVNVMTKEEALQLIESLTLHKINVQDNDMVEKLIEKLGYLPLALAQASAYIRNNGISFKGYLERYEQAEQKMLADNTMPEGTGHMPVSITWNANFEAIKTEAIAENIHPPSTMLITLCAYLAPNQIPKELLLNWLKKNYPKQANPELLLDQLLGQLNRYSLITLDPNKETIDIHRLVQAVLRHQHGKAVKEFDPSHFPITQLWYENLLNVAHEEFTRKTSVIKDEQRKHSILPHLQSLMKHYADLNLDPKSSVLGHVAFDTGFALLFKEPSLSKDYLEQSLGIFEKKYGTNHLYVSRTLRYLGHIHWALGDIKQSKVLLEKALKIDERINSTEIASTLNNLGNIYGVLGRVTEQCQLLERVLKMDEESKNTNSNDIAVSLNNLGNAYVASGEVIKGKLMIERSLGIFEKEYGQDFFKAGSVLTSLGHANWVLGNLEQAKLQLEKGLKIKEQYYHPEHIAIGVSLNNLGNLYKDLGDTTQALSCFKKALNISEQHYGKHHLATAIIVNNLGRLHQSMKNTDQSEHLFVRATEIKKTYEIGEFSLNFGTAYGILGDVCHKTILQSLKTIESH